MRSSTAFALTAALSVAALAGPSPAAQTGGQTAKPQAAQPRASTQGGQKSPAQLRAEAYQKFIEAERFEAQGDFVKAVEAYKQAIELAPDQDSPRAALARLYLQYRNIADARATALEAVRINKDSLPARRVLAHIAIIEAVSSGGVDKEKAKTAITELEELVRVSPSAEIPLQENQPTKALMALGSLYMSIGDEPKALAAFEKLSTVEPSAEAFFSLAQLYSSQNRYREAARAAEQARKIEPTRLDIADLLAQSYLRVGRSADALTVYKDALGAASDENRDAVRLRYADALVKVGKYAEAVESLKPVLAVDAKNVAAVRITADAHRRTGRRDLAVKTLEEALVGQDVSESLELVFYLAETYEEMENFDKAVATYEEALTALLNPDGTVSPKDRQNAGVILRRIADVHRLAGKAERMNATYERMRKVLGAESTLPDLLIIQHALETADYDRALEVARARGASVTGDDKRSFQFAEAQALGRKGDLPGAMKVLEALAKSRPDDVDVYSVMAAVQLDSGDSAAAERSIRRALELEPNDTGLLITLSSIQDRAGKYKDSEATLRGVLARDPDNATALNNLGYFLTERKERLDEALQLIQRAVNIDPTNGSFLDSLGWAYFQLGKLEEAKKYLEQASMYERTSSTIREHLGDLYQKLGDMKLARQHWESAVRLANEPDEITRLKDKLKTLQASQ